VTVGSGGSVGIATVGIGVAVAGADGIGVALGKPGVGDATLVGGAVGATVGAAAEGLGVAGAAVSLAGGAVLPLADGPVACAGVVAEGESDADGVATGLAAGAPFAPLTSFVAVNAASARPIASAGPSTR
jgi:hypothetical protein